MGLFCFLLFCRIPSLESTAVKPQAHKQPQLILKGRENIGVFNSSNTVCERMVCCAGTSITESMDSMLKMYPGFSNAVPS
jgi:hypothetical protein